MYIDISMKHKKDIHMKLDIPELFVVYFWPLFINFFEGHDKECPLRKVNQYSNCSFGEFIYLFCLFFIYTWAV